MSSGKTAPTRIEDSTSSAVASAGTRRSRRKIAAKNAAAQITAMANRISLAGSTALMSVKPAPLNVGSLRVLESSVYRSNQ